MHQIVRHIGRLEESLWRVEWQFVGLKEALGRIEEAVSRQQCKFVTSFFFLSLSFFSFLFFFWSIDMPIAISSMI